ncbi:L-2-amino-thiazoline-4-carboxylic acid hydrolase [Thermomonospora echinospora]|uniref:L-2-amino-thiazoline-4-carboxylic acid hydrolase n=1 Tax=Thermomonospora echinospora TaxID=1992 RepID=A0A1H6CLI3_9ACTN|nr:L-2-amino-thiazoline-4-carboxylic acid hydrolase [Thermomonospora echinospora]SEG73778.1 L-2-amino-thiazoline-4-carboxylic acid hydrolase [Thermomonospora echinospora]
MPTDRFGLSGGDYVPDPERETAALVEGFFEHITAALRAHALPEGLVAVMRTRHERLQAANAHLIVDEPARHNLRITLAVAAAYESLLPRLGRDAAIDTVRAALVEPLGDAVHVGTRAMLDAAPDPFAALVAVSKSREEHAFGKGFTFRRPADDDRRYLLNIHRCFYHDVLVANSVPELTPAMCAFDANWIEAIDPDRDGFRFERVTTIGLGGTHCPFHFTRTDPGEADPD